MLKVRTHYTAATQDTEFYESFNQVTFFNYDINSGVQINKLPVPPAAQTTGPGGTYTIPSSHTISLNEGEVNTTNFQIDLLGSRTANLQIVYTQYEGLGL